MISRLISLLIIAVAVVAAFKLFNGDLGAAAVWAVDLSVRIIDTGSDIALDAYTKLRDAV